MYSVELYGRVRRACHVDGMSEREAARQFGIDRKTVSKILKHSMPPGYRREGPPVRPKLDPFVGIIDQILEEDKSRIKKQRHTAKRIYERLRDEHGFTGGITIVTDYVRERKRRTREVFVPLAHAPGHAQSLPRTPIRGGFRRGAWRDWRGRAQAALLCDGVAPLRCILRQGLPGRDDARRGDQTHRWPAIPPARGPFLLRD